MKFRLTMVALLLILMALTVGCSKDNDKNDADVLTSFEDIQVHEQFAYATTKSVNVELTVLNGSGEGVDNIPFKVFDIAPKEGGSIIDSGATNEDGIANFYVTIPSHLKELYVEGYMASLTLPIVENMISYEFGTDSDNEERNDPEWIMPEKAPGLEYVSGYDKNGIPYNMTKDNIPTNFLKKVNTTLPEGRPVPQYHPHYLAQGNQLNVLVIDEPADVWVTFVTEGAGFTSSLGYYTYQEGNPPQSRDDIDVVNVVFPKIRATTRGWIFNSPGLVPGNKVYLGQFEPGTVIGWVLMADGWYKNAAHLVTNSWFSNKNLNPNNNQQSIMAYDSEYNKLLFAFEDIALNEGGCDHDYNDAVFYATANPIESIDIGDVPPVDPGDDADGDGISDIFDDFPQDADRAFQTNNHNKATLVFEDLWPDKGDYDFNDMVIDYNMFFHKNAEGKVANLIVELKLQAVGAKRKNGFGVQFPFSSSNISSMSIVDGMDQLTFSDVISDSRFNPTLEEGDKATIIFIENTADFMDGGSNGFVNTVEGDPYITPVVIALDIKFETPEDMTNWEWNVPFNPFIFINKDRGCEVHLVDYPPTPLANLALLGTNDDTSDISQNRYYKTINNHPWALNIPDGYDHTYESKKINHAYPKFKKWAESSGALYPDWYKDLPGYRNSEMIYQKP
ncbi:MAG: LruC domain-containing protein [Candidatus Cloacimonadales bacterium]